MVTTIGIDPHKATHTAVAINDSETVLGELTIPADRSQTKTLLDWAQNLDGDGRIWAVEAAGGLGICYPSSWSPPAKTLSTWPQCSLLGFGCWGRADHRRTTRTTLCRWWSPRYASRTWRWFVGRTTPRSFGCWRNVTSSSPDCALRRCVPPRSADTAATRGNNPTTLSRQSVADVGRDA